MELAHAGDDGLAGLLVEVRAERGVLAPDGGERLGEPPLVVRAVGLDRHADDRLGEGHAFEDDGGVGVAERVAGVGVLDPDDGDDGARADLFERLAVLGVHLEDAADILLLAVERVEQAAALLEHARVDAHVGQIAVGVVDDLEDQGGEGGVVRV